jgi:hypothetical protein
MKEYFTLAPAITLLMQCSYMIGIGFTQEMQDSIPFKHATSGTDKGVVVSWNTATSDETKRRATWLQSEFMINPLNWSAEVNVSGSNTDNISLMKFYNNVNYIQHKGEMTGENKTIDGCNVVVTNLTSTDFLTSAQIAAQDEYNLGYLHHYDISLFAGSLMNNIMARLSVESR